MAAQNRNTKGLPTQVNLTAESMLFYYFPITLLRGKGRSAVRLKADVTDLLSACAPDRSEQEGPEKEGSSFDNRKERTLSQTKRMPSLVLSCQRAKRPLTAGHKLCHSPEYVTSLICCSWQHKWMLFALFFLQ